MPVNASKAVNHAGQRRHRNLAPQGGHDQECGCDAGEIGSVGLGGCGGLSELFEDEPMVRRSHESHCGNDGDGANDVILGHFTPARLRQ
jgi:hypothetical protein